MLKLTEMQEMLYNLIKKELYIYILTNQMDVKIIYNNKLNK